VVPAAANVREVDRPAFVRVLIDVSRSFVDRTAADEQGSGQNKYFLLLHKCL
jgi:hypothetical protein